MSLDPIPLATSGKKARLADLETNLRNAAAILGGHAYQDGAHTGAMPGGVAVADFKGGSWLDNARKSEPHSYVVFEGRLQTATDGNWYRLVVPGVGCVASPISVTVYAVFESGAPLGIVNVWICGTGVAGLEPTVPNTPVSSTTAAAWTPSLDPSKNYIEVSLDASGAAPGTMSNLKVIVVIKAKHVE